MQWLIVFIRDIAKVLNTSNFFLRCTLQWRGMAMHIGAIKGHQTKFCGKWPKYILEIQHH